MLRQAASVSRASTKHAVPGSLAVAELAPSNRYDAHPKRSGALGHRIVETEYALSVQIRRDGKVKRVARPQLQGMVARPLGGTVEFFPSGSDYRAMLLREFADPRDSLPCQARRCLPGAHLDRSG
ncbi:hypothetical protein D3C83_28270 [compost metagenome]